MTLWLIGLTGLYLKLGLRLMPLRQLGFGIREALGSIRSSKGEGDVTAFESLSTARVLALKTSLGVPELATGLVTAVIAFLVLIGGSERIGNVTEVVVPFMAFVYVGGAMVILLAHLAEIPAALGVILNDAFTGQAVAGGSLGLMIQKGIARGVFSNEAGPGTAPIAQAAAKPGDPVLQGSVAMLGTFIDTIIVCTMTAMVIVISYSERCLEFLVGTKAIRPFRVVWVVVVIGAVATGGVIWTIADILNGLMAIPNLIGLLLLSGTVFRLTRAYDFKATGRSA